MPSSRQPDERWLLKISKCGKHGLIFFQMQFRLFLWGVILLRLCSWKYFKWMPISSIFTNCGTKLHLFIPVHIQIWHIKWSGILCQWTRDANDLPYELSAVLGSVPAAGSAGAVKPRPCPQRTYTWQGRQTRTSNLFSTEWQGVCAVIHFVLPRWLVRKAAVAKEQDKLHSTASTVWKFNLCQAVKQLGMCNVYFKYKWKFCVCHLHILPFTPWCLWLLE